MREFLHWDKSVFLFRVAVTVLMVVGLMVRGVGAQQSDGQPSVGQATTEQSPQQSTGTTAADSTVRAPVQNVQIQNVPAQNALIPVVFEGKIPAEQLQFLNGYVGESTKKLFKDKQFKAVLKQVIPKTTYHYGKDMPLSETVDTLLHTGALPVTVRAGRYLMAASHDGPYLHGRAFLWIDLQEGIALGGVYFRPVNGEPKPTLAIYSAQLRVSVLSMSQLPAEFLKDVRDWSAVVRVPGISVRYFIPQSGRKYVLVHDENFCIGGLSGIEPDPEACLQRKIDAAEVDEVAAAFITRTHNAANSTAWMLLPDVEQAEWMEQRKKICGVQRGNVECWLRVTHERTDALIAKRKQ
jgi:hypothetical protein